MNSEFHLFTRESVAKDKNVVENPDEPADPEGGGGFAEWAMLTLQALRIELGKSYRQTVDLLSEMPGILEEIGLVAKPFKVCYQPPEALLTGCVLRCQKSVHPVRLPLQKGQVPVFNSPSCRLMTADPTLHLADDWASDGNVYFTGKLIGVDGDVDPFEIFTSEVSEEDLFNRLSGVSGFFSSIINKGDKILIISDTIRSVPVFYSTDGKYISDNYYWIQDQIGGGTIPHDTLIEFIQSRSIFGRETLHPDINKVGNAEVLSIPLKDNESPQPKKYFELDTCDTNRSVLSGNFLNEVENSLDHVMKNLNNAIDDAPVILQLSSGYDSRALAYSLYKSEIDDIYAYTYSIEDNSEVQSAKYIADQLGFEWDHIDISAEDLSSNFKSELWWEYEKAVGGHGVDRPRLRDLIGIKKVKESNVMPENGYFIIGHNIFHANEKYPREFLHKDTVLTDDYISSLIQERYSQIPNSEDTIKILENMIRRLDIHNGLGERISSEKAINLFEKFYFYEYLPNKSDSIKKQFKIQGYNIWFPYLDTSFLDFYRSLPLDKRDKRKLLTEYVESEDAKILDDTSEINTSESVIYKGTRRLFEGWESILTPIGPSSDEISAIEYLKKEEESIGSVPFDELFYLCESHHYKNYLVFDLIFRSELDIDKKIHKYYDLKYLG